jgi:hypothetical protein
MEAEIEIAGDNGQLSLYFATQDQELADLVVVAEAAIEWAKGTKGRSKRRRSWLQVPCSLVAAKPRVQQLDRKG